MLLPLCFIWKPDQTKNLHVLRSSQWPVPATKNVEMMRIRDMDWTRNKKRSQSQTAVLELDDEQFQTIIQKFEDLGCSPAIARLVEPFASKLQEKNTPPPLPEPLDSIFREEFAERSYYELLAEGDNIVIAISAEEVSTIEALTRNQSQNYLWLKYRAGRITASKFKSVCRASLEKPPLSLIKGICYPQKVNVYTQQTSSDSDIHIHFTFRSSS